MSCRWPRSLRSEPDGRASRVRFAHPQKNLGRAGNFVGQATQIAAEKGHWANRCDGGSAGAGVEGTFGGGKVVTKGSEPFEQRPKVAVA